MLFVVETRSKEKHSIQLRYSNSSQSPILASLYVNDQKAPSQIQLAAHKNKNEWSDVKVKAKLNAGINFITVQKNIIDDRQFDLDYIRIGE